MACKGDECVVAYMVAMFCCGVALIIGKAGLRVWGGGGLGCVFKKVMLFLVDRGILGEVYVLLY